MQTKNLKLAINISFFWFVILSCTSWETALWEDSDFYINIDGNNINQPHEASCSAQIPRAACADWKQFINRNQSLSWSETPADLHLNYCQDGGVKIGEWRFALAQPFNSLQANISLETLAKYFTEGRINATEAARSALHPMLHSLKSVTSKQIRSSSAHFSLVSIADIHPQMKLLRINQIHPLDKGARYPLQRGLCVNIKETKVRKWPIITNFKKDKLTQIMMTGVTALTRGTAHLIEKRGVRYPTKSIKHVFNHADFVHVSNEVSFRPNCKIASGGLSFCSKENYIKILEEIGTNIVELTGSHLTDQGKKWLAHTIKMYEDRGWMVFGGGLNQKLAKKPITFQHNGNKIAILGCNLPEPSRNSFLQARIQRSVTGPI